MAQGMAAATVSFRHARPDATIARRIGAVLLTRTVVKLHLDFEEQIGPVQPGANWTCPTVPITSARDYVHRSTTELPNVERVAPGRLAERVVSLLPLDSFQSLRKHLNLKFRRTL